MSKELHWMTIGSSLPLHSINRIRTHLRNGGFCIVPSDTGYALTGLPFRKDVVKKISQVLHHESDAIPLTFGSLSMVEKYAKLSKKDYILLETLCPGPITLICDINSSIEQNRRKAISDLLHTPGTIGVRIPDSPVERQISIELDTPITTCAIRYDNDNKEIVRNFDDAVTLICERMHELVENFFIIGIRADRIHYNEQSTVVSVQKNVVHPMKFKIFRYGVIEHNDIRSALDLPNEKDFDDFT